MSVQVEKLMEIVADSGMEIEDQAAFYKVAVGNRAVYIAKTKKVSRVDLSGFDFSHPAVTKISERDAKELKLGKVRGQIDFSKSEDRVLEAFRTALGLLQHLAATPDNGPTPTVAKSANKNRRKKAIEQTATTRSGGRKHTKGASKSTGAGAEAHS